MRHRIEALLQHLNDECALPFARFNAFRKAAGRSAPQRTGHLTHKCFG
jgi:hypothetical protein